MKVLVTGAAGFIGKHLVSRLSAWHEVFAVVRYLPAEFLGERVSLIGIDLAGLLERSKLPERMDAIIHLAQANVSFPESANELFTVNTGVTQQLLDYGRQAGVHRFILASSGDVYGHRLGPCRETDIAVPTSFYGVTKYASELLVNAYASYLEPCVLRLFQPYGPGQSNRLIPKLADRIRQRAPVRLHRHDRPRVSPTYIDDVVTAFEQALQAPKPDLINVAGETVVSMRELAEEIGQVLHCQPAFEETGEEAGDMIGDNRCLKEVFRLRSMVGLAEGLSRTFANREGNACQNRV